MNPENPIVIWAYDHNVAQTLGNWWLKVWDPEPQALWVGTYQTIRWFHWKRTVYIDSIKRVDPLRYNAMLMPDHYAEAGIHATNPWLKIWVLPWQVRRKGLKNLFRRHRTNE